MPIEEFALDTTGTRRVQVSRETDLVREYLIVLLDRSIIGHVSQEELITGREFPLPDGSILKVQLVNNQTQVLRNGQHLHRMTAIEVSKVDARSEASGEQKSLFARLFTHPAVRQLSFFVGCLLIIGGSIFIYSTTSRYRSVDGTVTGVGLDQACISSPQTCKELDVQLDNYSSIPGGTSYAIHFADFTSRPTAKQVGFGAYVRLVYSGTKVVEIADLDSNDRISQIFTTPEYTSYIQTDRDAGIHAGIAAVVAGVVIATLAL